MWLWVAFLTISVFSPATASGQGRPPRRVPSSLPSPGIALGFFESFTYNPGKPPSNFSAIGGLISQLGHTPAIVQGFYSWKLPDGTYRAFPKDFADYVTGQNSTPMITWQPGQCGTDNQVVVGGSQDQTGFSVAAIASGMHDAYIGTWADAAKAYPHTIYVRLMHEMNDPVYPWSYGVNGNTSIPEFVTAWQHVVGIFHEKNVTNVQFVWCIGAKFGVQTGVEGFFPGDDYTDWVSIDGYNRDTSGEWETAQDIFSTNYALLTKISSRPLMIAETGCVEDPNDPTAKPNWITDTLLNVFAKQMPRIKAVLYFNSTGRGYTYPLDSSAASFAAYESVVNSPLYQAAAPAQSLTY
jgi:beta-mannanase